MPKMLSSIFLSALAASVEARNLTFNHESVVLNGSLYQSAYLDGNVFATSSVGKIVNESYIFKVDANSLKVVESVRPDRDNKSGLLWAVYGAGSNSKKNHIWVTNTRLSTVSVYNSDLSLVSHLPVNTTLKPRDVVVNNQDEKAYVTGKGSGIGVYDANDLTYSGWIELQTESQQFTTTMELVLDSANQVIYTVSLSSNVAAAVDLKNNNKVTYYHLGNATRASGVAYDTKRSTLYVVSQGSDQIMLIDTKEGANATSKAVSLPTTFSTRAAHDDVRSEIHVEDGDLFAGYEPKNDLIYVVNRVHAEVYVIDPSTHEVVSTLKTGKNPNHVTFDPNGVAFVTDKDTPTRLHRFSLQGAGSNSSSSAGASASGSRGGAASASASSSGKGKGKGSGSSPSSNGAAQVLASAGVALVPALALLI